MFKIKHLLFGLLILSGCSTFEPKESPKIKQDTVIVFIKINPMLPQGVLGRSKIGNGVCHIELKQYPVCLAHEMRHCFEGKWHGDQESAEWCYE